MLLLDKIAKKIIFNVLALMASSCKTNNNAFCKVIYYHQNVANDLHKSSNKDDDGAIFKTESF